MTSDQYARIKTIFLEACKQPAETRDSFIAEACGGDKSMIQEVERLLSHHSISPHASNQDPSDKLSDLKALAEEISELPTFQTGDMVVDRYRIVSLLGEGGMGRVYRAEDFRLNQAVALKFLPRLFVLDPIWRRRVESEVKLSREVGHTNICRVYDLGDDNGAPFISMEYVDGEDLASLLRRVGRLTGTRAIDIARQICTGLAVAHIHGVLHRDLKPANIMIDQSGRVRITDFGLAVMSGHVEQGQIRAGTPRYMAPEQLSGIAVDEKSDIYSLGLVLYEMFTGRPAFDADNALDYLRQHRTAAPTPPSTIVPEIDPKVEAVILACLHKDPALRPESALNVAAALPGGDLLAAALDAGQIPTREMLATAAAQGSINRRSMFQAALAAIILYAIAFLFGHDTHPIAKNQGVKSPEFLFDRATEISRLAGNDLSPIHANGRFIPAADAASLGSESAAYGESSTLAVPAGEVILYSYHEDRNNRTAPGIDVLSFIMPGTYPFFFESVADASLRIILDGQGRLLLFESFQRKPVGAHNGNRQADWQSMLRMTGRDPEDLQPIEDSTPPRAKLQEQLAFQSQADGVRIEVELFDECIRRVAVLSPASESVVPGNASSQDRWKLIRTLRNTVMLVLLAVAMPGAWLNWKRRGDFTGAVRLGVFVFSLRLLSGLIDAGPSGGYFGTIENLANLAVSALSEGMIVALFYMAMESQVRRLWPRTFGGWSRLLAGRIRDPFVGRDVLLGCAVGNLWAILAFLDRRIPEWMGWQTRTQLRLYQGLDDVLGVRAAIAGLFDSLRTGIYQGLALLLILVIAGWLAGKRRWLALLMAWLIGAALFAPTASHPVTAWTLYALGIAPVGLYVLTKWGLVSLLSAILVTSLLTILPITTNHGAWFAGYGTFACAATLGLGLWGMIESLRPPMLESHPTLPR